LVAGSILAGPTARVFQRSVEIEGARWRILPGLFDPSGALVVLLLDGSFKDLSQYLVILILEKSAAFREAFDERGIPPFSTRAERRNVCRVSEIPGRSSALPPSTLQPGERQASMPRPSPGLAGGQAC
jgi:hypothetical protein